MFAFLFFGKISDAIDHHQSCRFVLCLSALAQAGGIANATHLIIIYLQLRASTSRALSSISLRRFSPSRRSILQRQHASISDSSVLGGAVRSSLVGLLFSGCRQIAVQS